MDRGTAMIASRARRSRGYAWEDALVKRIRGVDGWRSFRLGSPSVALPDIMAVNNSKKILMIIEAKSGTGTTLQVPADQLIRSQGGPRRWARTSGAVWCWPSSSSPKRGSARPRTPGAGCASSTRSGTAATSRSRASAPTRGARTPCPEGRGPKKAWPTLTCRSFPAGHAGRRARQAGRRRAGPDAHPNFEIPTAVTAGP